MAASTCPKCAHPISVRDGFGRPVPLAHCSTCDSDYPLHLGACRWCGTTPERAPVSPYVWKGVGVLAFVAMAWGAWLVRDDAPKEASASRMQSVLKPDTAQHRPADSAVARQALAQTDSAGVSAETVRLQSAGGLAEPEPAMAAEPTPVRPPARARSKAAPSKVAPAKSAAVKAAPSKAKSSKEASRTLASSKRTAKPSANSAKSGGWVTSRSRSWVVIRADANRRSRVIASIGPNTRVQLGELRGAWRRIRANGLTGWVEDRSISARAGDAEKARQLAAR